MDFLLLLLQIPGQIQKPRLRSRAPFLLVRRLVVLFLLGGGELHRCQDEIVEEMKKKSHRMIEDEVAKMLNPRLVCSLLTSTRLVLLLLLLPLAAALLLGRK